MGIWPRAWERGHLTHAYHKPLHTHATSRAPKRCHYATSTSAINISTCVFHLRSYYFILFHTPEAKGRSIPPSFSVPSWNYRASNIPLERPCLPLALPHSPKQVTDFFAWRAKVKRKRERIDFRFSQKSLLRQTSQWQPIHLPSQDFHTDHQLSKV